MAEQITVHHKGCGGQVEKRFKGTDPLVYDGAVIVDMSNWFGNQDQDNELVCMKCDKAKMTMKIGTMF